MITTPQHTFTYTPAHNCFSDYPLFKQRNAVFDKKPISYLLYLKEKKEYRETNKE